MTMQLVERHIITPTNNKWSQLDDVAFRSKNLWNAANYIMRQTLFETGKRLSAKDLYHLVRQHYPQDYEALPRKVSNQVLIQLEHAWKAWSKARAAYEQDPSRFTGRPRLPKYKHKTKGRNEVVYETGAISKRRLKKGYATPSQLGLEFPTKQGPESINQIRIIPRTTCYVVEVIYTAEEAKPMQSAYVAGVDLGINNLAAVASNKPGVAPFLVNGRPLKSINQFYNKHKASLQSQLPGQQKTSHRIQRLTHRRNCKVDDYLHKTSRLMIDWCVKHEIGTLIVGKNPLWKQQVNIGNRNNQNFVQIPHSRLIAMLVYKGQLAGVNVVTIEESYTSKCSFLDNEPLGNKTQYAGRRVKRGLFRASDGRLINADINGALNMIRKVAPNAFDADGVAGVAVRPVRVTPHQYKPNDDI